MGRRALVAVLVVPLACGARTALLLPGQGGNDTGGGGGSGGGSTPLAVTCAAALQAGAPTPIDGYCTTRANQAAMSGPRTGPTIAWSVTPFPILSPEDYLPAETVVDATGRAYIAINVSPQGPVGAPNQLIALNDDGSVAWISPFDTVVDQLLLGSDGRLWFPEASALGTCGNPPCSGELVALSPEGTQVATVVPFGSPSTLSIAAMAIASDGTFFVGSSDSLARLATDGTILWETSAYLDDTTILVGSDDDVVAEGGGDTDWFDAAGMELWSGPSADVAAIDAQGQVVGLSFDGEQTLSLTTLAAGGIPVMSLTIDPPQFTIDAYQLAVAGDGTAIVLIADEATSPGLTKARVQIIAVEPSGQTRWTTPLDVSLPYDPANLMTHYGVFVDAAGTVIVTAGTVMGLDLASGSVLWTLQPAKPNVCLRPAVLGVGGAILATQCDGTVFLARDP